MADQKISQLSDGGNAQAADEFVVARSGANYRIDGASVAAAATSVGTLSSLTISGDLTVDTSTLKVDSANNRVGIGTASPSYRTDISNGGGSAAALRVLGNDQSNVRLRIENSGSGGRAFELTGGLTGANNSDFTLYDATASATRLSVDASGNLAVDTNTLYVDATNNRVGIGTASPGSPLDVIRSSTSTTALNEPQIRAINTAAATLNQRVDIAMRWEDGTYNGTGGISMVRESATARSGSLVFSSINSSGDATQAMRLDASGNLGLGVTPSAWSASFKAMQFASLGAVWGSSTGMFVSNNTYNDGSNKYIGNGRATRYYQSTGEHIWENAANNTSGAGAACTLGVAMTLDADGKLLISKTSSRNNFYNTTASANIQLEGSGAARRVGIIGNDAGPALILGYTSSYQGNTLVANNDVVGAVSFQGNDGTEFVELASIIGAVNGTPGANDMPGMLIFSTTEDGAASPTERARITSGGYFKASNDGTYRNSTGAWHELRQTANVVAAQVDSINASLDTDIFISRATRNTTNNTFYALSYYNDGAAAYKWRVADSGNVTNTNGSYGTISDAKHKTDIVDAGSQWDDLKAVRFRKFKMKDDPSETVMLGVVAQELEQVSPGLIEEHPDTERVEVPMLDEDGNETGEVTVEMRKTGTVTKSVKTSVLLMKAAVALQEAMARIEALEVEVAALKAGA